MKVYIAGVVSKGGTLSEYERRKNFGQFYAEAERLKSLGHEPVNPLDLHPILGDVKWGDALRADLKGLLECDAISKLPGWNESRGAQLEVHIARELGMEEL